MVRRLVRRRLLRALTGTKSARAEEREPACLARRLVAASYQGHAHGGAFEYSPGVPIRGLWFPDRAVLDCLKVHPGRPAQDQETRAQILRVRLEAARTRFGF